MKKYWWLMLIVGLLPLMALTVDIVNDDLGANPIETIHLRLGDWSLRLLCLTLCVTPLKDIFGLRGVADFRQLLGLMTWFYATLHLLAYVILDQVFEWSLIVQDLQESFYMWFGLLAYMILLILAMTSPKQAKKVVGKYWKRLHRLIYFAAAAALLHYFLQLKGNLVEPLFYTLILLILLLFRVVVWYKQRTINSAKMLVSAKNPRV